jgi:hypothetical protein
MNKTLVISLVAIAISIGSLVGVVHKRSEETDRTTAQTPPDISTIALAGQGAHGETPPQGATLMAQQQNFIGPVVLGDPLRTVAMDTMKNRDIWDEAGRAYNVDASTGLDGRVFVMKNDRRNGRLVAIVVMNQPFKVDEQGDNAYASYVISDVDCNPMKAEPLVWMTMVPGHVVTSGTDGLGIDFDKHDLDLATAYFCTH